VDYDNTDTGVLFLNDKKSEKAPDYTGTYNHEGEDIKIAGWIRTSSKTGKQFISIKRDTYEPQAIEEDRQVATDAQSGKDFAREVASKFKKDEVAEVDGDEDMKSLMENIPF
jgi:aspartyl/asparaginyl-tRNA synthetase